MHRGWIASLLVAALAVPGISGCVHDHDAKRAPVPVFECVSVVDSTDHELVHPVLRFGRGQNDWCSGTRIRRERRSQHYSEVDRFACLLVLKKTIQKHADSAICRNLLTSDRRCAHSHVCGDRLAHVSGEDFVLKGPRLELPVWRDDANRLECTDINPCPRIESELLGTCAELFRRCIRRPFSGTRSFNCRLRVQEGHNRTGSADDNENESVNANPTISYKLAVLYQRLSIPVRIILSVSFFAVFLLLAALALRFGQRALQDVGWLYWRDIAATVAFVVLGHVACWLSVVGLIAPLMLSR